MTKVRTGFLKSELDELKRAIALEIVDQFPLTQIRAHVLKNLERWRLNGVWGSAYEIWHSLATGPDDEILLQIMIGRDQRAMQLRQSPPYVGLLSPERIQELASRLPLYESDPLADLIAKGAEVKDDLLHGCGALLLAEEVAELLGTSMEAVETGRSEAMLLAVWCKGRFIYPRLQFDEGQLVPGVQQILVLLKDAPWTALEFLVTPLEELSERSPLDVMKGDGPEAKELALRLARVLASDGFG